MIKFVWRYNISNEFEWLSKYCIKFISKKDVISLNYSDISLYKLSELSQIYGSEKLDSYKTNLKDTFIKGIHSEKIVYNSSILKSLLVEINTLYSSIIDLQLEKEILLLDAYESATIEGARTTIEEVKCTLKSGRNTKDTYMVKDTLAASILAYSSNFKINLDSICDIWKVVTQNVCENRNQQLNNSRFRTGMVYVSDGIKVVHIPEKPENIESKLTLFLQQISQLEESIFVKAALLHFYLVYIHPFCEGNGRTARICFNSYLYHNGIKNINKIALSKHINKDRNNYYKSISESEKTVKLHSNVFLDITPSIYYLLNTLKEAMVNTLLLQNKLSEEEKKLLTKMQKRGKGAEITVRKCSKILSLSEQKCRIILNNLTNQGYFSKRKEKTNNIYTLLIR